MSIDSKLLEIIRCPVAKVCLTVLSAEQLQTINCKIAAGELNYADGSQVDEQLEAGLITDTGTRVYRIDSGIPIMLEIRSIPVNDIN